MTRSSITQTNYVTKYVYVYVYIYIYIYVYIYVEQEVFRVTDNIFLSCIYQNNNDDCTPLGAFT